MMTMNPSTAGNGGGSSTMMAQQKQQEQQQDASEASTSTMATVSLTLPATVVNCLRWYKPTVLEEAYAVYTLQHMFRISLSDICDSCFSECDFTVEGKDAVPFLTLAGSGSESQNVNRMILRHVWTVADPDGLGKLQHLQQWIVILRLTALAQLGLLQHVLAKVATTVVASNNSSTSAPPTPVATLQATLVQTQGMPCRLAHFEGFDIPSDDVLLQLYRQYKTLLQQTEREMQRKQYTWMQQRLLLQNTTNNNTTDSSSMPTTTNADNMTTTAASASWQSSSSSSSSSMQATNLNMPAAAAAAQGGSLSSFSAAPPPEAFGTGGWIPSPVAKSSPLTTMNSTATSQQQQQEDDSQKTPVRRNIRLAASDTEASNPNASAASAFLADLKPPPLSMSPTSSRQTMTTTAQQQQQQQNQQQQNQQQQNRFQFYTPSTSTSTTDTSSFTAFSYPATAAAAAMSGPDSASVPSSLSSSGHDAESSYSSYAYSSWPNTTTNTNNNSSSSMSSNFQQALQQQQQQTQGQGQNWPVPSSFAMDHQQQQQQQDDFGTFQQSHFQTFRTTTATATGGFPSSSNNDTTAATTTTTTTSSYYNHVGGGFQAPVVGGLSIADAFDSLVEVHDQPLPSLAATATTTAPAAAHASVHASVMTSMVTPPTPTPPPATVDSVSHQISALEQNNTNTNNLVGTAEEEDDDFGDFVSTTSSMAQPSVSSVVSSPPPPQQQPQSSMFAVSAENPFATLVDGITFPQQQQQPYPLQPTISALSTTTTYAAVDGMTFPQQPPYPLQPTISALSTATTYATASMGGGGGGGMSISDAFANLDNTTTTTAAIADTTTMPLSSSSWPPLHDAGQQPFASGTFSVASSVGMADTTTEEWNAEQTHNSTTGGAAVMDAMQEEDDFGDFAEATAEAPAALSSVPSALQQYPPLSVEPYSFSNMPSFIGSAMTTMGPTNSHAAGAFAPAPASLSSQVSVQSAGSGRMSVSDAFEGLVDIADQPLPSLMMVSAPSSTPPPPLPTRTISSDSVGYSNQASDGVVVGEFTSIIPDNNQGDEMPAVNPFSSTVVNPFAGLQGGTTNQQSGGDDDEDVFGDFGGFVPVLSEPPQPLATGAGVDANGQGSVASNPFSTPAVFGMTTSGQPQVHDDLDDPFASIGSNSSSLSQPSGGSQYGMAFVGAFDGALSTNNNLSSSHVPVPVNDTLFGSLDAVPTAPTPATETNVFPQSDMDAFGGFTDAPSLTNTGAAMTLDASTRSEGGFVGSMGEAAGTYQGPPPLGSIRGLLGAVLVQETPQTAAANVAVPPPPAVSYEAPLQIPVFSPLDSWVAAAARTTPPDSVMDPNVSGGDAAQFPVASMDSSWTVPQPVVDPNLSGWDALDALVSLQQEIQPLPSFGHVENLSNSDNVPALAADKDDDDFGDFSEPVPPPEPKPDENEFGDFAGTNTSIPINDLGIDAVDASTTDANFGGFTKVAGSFYSSSINDSMAVQPSEQSYCVSEGDDDEFGDFEASHSAASSSRDVQQVGDATEIPGASTSDSIAVQPSEQSYPMSGDDEDEDFGEFESTKPPALVLDDPSTGISDWNLTRGVAVSTTDSMAVQPSEQSYGTTDDEDFGDFEGGVEVAAEQASAMPDSTSGDTPTVSAAETSSFEVDYSDGGQASMSYGVNFGFGTQIAGPVGWDALDAFGEIQNAPLRSLSTLAVTPDVDSMEQSPVTLVEPIHEFNEKSKSVQGQEESNFGDFAGTVEATEKEEAKPQEESGYFGTLEQSGYFGTLEQTLAPASTDATIVDDVDDFGDFAGVGADATPEPRNETTNAEQPSAPEDHEFSALEPAASEQPSSNDSGVSGLPSVDEQQPENTTAIMPEEKFVEKNPAESYVDVGHLPEDPSLQEAAGDPFSIFDALAPPQSHLVPLSSYSTMAISDNVTPAALGEASSEDNFRDFSSFVGESVPLPNPDNNIQNVQSLTSDGPEKSERTDTDFYSVSGNSDKASEEFDDFQDAVEDFEVGEDPQAEGSQAVSPPNEPIYTAQERGDADGDPIVFDSMVPNSIGDEDADFGDFTGFEQPPNLMENQNDTNAAVSTGGFTAIESREEKVNVVVEDDVGDEDADFGDFTGVEQPPDLIENQHDTKAAVSTGGFTALESQEEKENVVVEDDFGGADADFGVFTGFEQPPNLMENQNDTNAAVSMGGFTAIESQEEKENVVAEDDFGREDADFGVFTGLEQPPDLMENQNDTNAAVSTGGFTAIQSQTEKEHVVVEDDFGDFSGFNEAPAVTSSSDSLDPSVAGASFETTLAQSLQTAVGGSGIYDSLPIAEVVQKQEQADVQNDAADSSDDFAGFNQGQVLNRDSDEVGELQQVQNATAGSEEVAEKSPEDVSESFCGFESFGDFTSVPPDTQISGPDFAPDQAHDLPVATQACTAPSPDIQVDDEDFGDFTSFGDHGTSSTGTDQIVPTIDPQLARLSKLREKIVNLSRGLPEVLRGQPGKADGHVDFGHCFDANIGMDSPVTEIQIQRAERCVILLSLLSSTHIKLASTYWAQAISVTRNELSLGKGVLDKAATLSPQDKAGALQPLTVFVHALGEFVRITRSITATIGDLLMLDASSLLTIDTVSSSWCSIPIVEEALQVEKLWKGIEDQSKVIGLPSKQSSSIGLESLEVIRRVSATSHSSDKLCHFTLQPLQSADLVKGSTKTGLKWNGKEFMACSANFLANKCAFYATNS